MAYSPLSVYKHTQSTAAAQWTIVHNIGRNNNNALPVIEVYVNVPGGIDKILPASTDVSTPGTAVLTFSGPFSGYALITI